LLALPARAGLADLFSCVPRFPVWANLFPRRYRR
jgi:hypothetical protein